jgi:hypothetical protein
VNAIGDVGDWHITNLVVWPNFLPHFSGDRTVKFTYAISLGRHSQSEDGHIEAGAPILFMFAKIKKLFSAQSQFFPISGKKSCSVLEACEPFELWT